MSNIPPFLFPHRRSTPPFGPEAWTDVPGRRRVPTPPVTSVNGKLPDSNGNVEIFDIDEYLVSAAKTGSTVSILDSAGRTLTFAAEANVIEGVSVNGVPAPVSGKVSRIDVPTSLSDLAPDAAHRTVTDEQIETWNSKAPSFVLDDVPTEGSPNPVKSGGVRSWTESALSPKRDLSDLSVREYGPGHGSFALHVDDSSDTLAWADGIWAGNAELTGLDYWVDVPGQWPSVRLTYGFDGTSVCEFGAADGVEGDFQVLDPGTMTPVTRHFRIEPYVPDVDALARVSQVPPDQVNADWNATSGKAAILNKPDVALKRDLTDNQCAVDSWGGEFRIIGEPPQSWGRNYRLVAVDAKSALLEIDGAVVAEYAISQDLRYAEFKGGNMTYEPFRNFERTEIDAKATESFLTRSGLPKPDWNQTDESAADYVRNKPDLSLKRDRTDNVACSDSAYWTGPDPSGKEVVFKWTPVPNEYGFDCWDYGGLFLFEKGHGGDVSHLIGRDWTGEADVSIQQSPGSSSSYGPATRHLVAKSGESYVTPSYVKDTAYGKGKREDGSPVDQELHDFFTSSNGLLTGTIKSEGTAPDAHLEAPTDERLKLVLADNSVAYDSAKALPYKLASAIGDRVIASLTLNAASTDITLPSTSASDTTVKDFILDVTNAYSVEGVATDAGINIPRTDVKLVTRDGESLSEVTTVKAGKSAFLCFTQKSPVVVGGVTYPCWFVVKVELGEPA